MDIICLNYCTISITKKLYRQLKKMYELNSRMGSNLQNRMDSFKKIERSVLH